MAGRRFVSPFTLQFFVWLGANGFAAIHGDKQQNERDWVLDQFKTGKSPIMVATDVASRGIGMNMTPPPLPRGNFQQSYIRCALLSCLGAFSIAHICLTSSCLVVLHPG